MGPAAADALPPAACDIKTDRGYNKYNVPYIPTFPPLLPTYSHHLWATHTYIIKIASLHKVHETHAPDDTESPVPLLKTNTPT